VPEGWRIGSGTPFARAGTRPERHVPQPGRPRQPETDHLPPRHRGTHPAPAPHPPRPRSAPV